MPVKSMLSVLRPECLTLSRLTLTRPTPVRRVLVLAVAGLLLAAAASAGEAAGDGAVTVHLTGELGPIDGLEIGRSLRARATGLDAAVPVFFVLRDEAGQVVASAAAFTDATGASEEVEVWRRSGVVGCGCDRDLGSYEFGRLEDAVATLGGRVFSVVVLDPAGLELAAVPVSLAAPARPLGLPSDAAGCPLFGRPAGEDLFLAVFGGAEGQSCEARVLPLAADGEVILEAPPIAAPAVWVGGSSSGVQLLVIGDESGLPTDLYFWFRCDGLGINSGMVIEDHSCPPPPPEDSPEPPTR